MKEGSEVDELASIWANVMACLQSNLSTPGYQTFLSSALPLAYADNILTIGVTNGFSKEWIKEKCEPIIREKFLNGSSPTLLIRYEMMSAQSSVEPDYQLSILPVEPASAAKPEFNTRYTFENFIVGHNNRFAHAASEAVAKAPAKAYNPLFIYGSVGLGKTHLLHAIGNRALEQFSKIKVKIVSSEKFTNDMINAIKDKKTDAFRGKYRTLDILLVDDIQFLAGKEQTQEEFFHTFNDLHGNNRQIIITSDRSPKDIPTLEDRLRTRFEWGLIADIQPPELETRIAILRKKIEDNQFLISDEILHYIASQVPNNVREMEGALTRIAAYAKLLNTDVTLAIASNVIRDMVGIKTEKPLTITYIKRKVCDYFYISEMELCSKSRTKDVAFARQIAMYLARELTNVSLPKIGESFGNRDHSTVMHAVDKIKMTIESDSDVRNIVNVLFTQIRSGE